LIPATKKIASVKYPNRIPVHLAHNGN